MLNKIIYIWGYGNTTPSVFRELINEWVNRLGVTHLIDVRKNPRGWASCYHKSSLQKITELKYIHIEELGNPDKSTLDKYSEYMKTENFKQGMNKLLRIFTNNMTGNIIIFCSEKDYHRCHRQFIAKILSSDPYNFNVKYI